MSAERIASLLREWIGIEPTAVGESMFWATLDREMARVGAVDTTSYAERLERRGQEAEALAASLLVHETFLFRYPASFEHLAAFARARKQAGRLPLRVLCVPCSTGEEPASIAITLADAGLDPDETVLDASDVSAAAVMTAREGWFHAGSFRGFDADSRPDAVTTENGRRRLAARYRERIRYRVGNILEPVPEGGASRYDVVFCRNLLIYLTREARTRALTRIDQLLAPDGQLYVGHAEVGACAEAGFVGRTPANAFVCGRAPPRPVKEQPRVRPSPAAGLRPAPPRPPRRVEPLPASRPAPVAPIVALDEARRLADRGELAQALALLERDLDAGNHSADHFHLIAVIHRAGDRPDLADSALGRALYLDPGHRAALIQSALAAEARGDDAAARRFRTRAAREEASER